MPYTRGEIVLVAFPNSDLRTAKLRPALVVQATDLNTQLPQTVVAMITSNLSRVGHPSRIVARVGSPEGRESGLLTDSVVMTDNLSTILDQAITRVIGFWKNMTVIDRALIHTLGLDVE